MMILFKDGYVVRERFGFFILLRDKRWERTSSWRKNITQLYLFDTLDELLVLSEKVQVKRIKDFSLHQ